MAPDSSPRMAWSGKAWRRISMIAASAALSTWVTKSLARLEWISSLLRSSAARLMMLPARRAAWTGMLSMGCRGGFFYYGASSPAAFVQRTNRALPPQPPGQHRRRRARDEDHGPGRPAAGRAGEVSRAGSAMDGDQCPG